MLGRLEPAASAFQGDVARIERTAQNVAYCLPAHFTMTVLANGARGHCHVVKCWTMQSPNLHRSQYSCCLMPVVHGFGTELTECASGSEMALEVEGVVDGSMNRKEALS